MPQPDPSPAAPRDLYPPVEPYDHGLLDVGDGHRVYWEVLVEGAGHAFSEPGIRAALLDTTDRFTGG